MAEGWSGGAVGTTEQRRSGELGSSGPPCAVAAVRAARAGRAVAGGVAVRADLPGELGAGAFTLSYSASACFRMGMLRAVDFNETLGLAKNVLTLLGRRCASA